MDQQLIKLLGYTGSFPALGTFVTLWVYGRKSWYILALSVTTFILSFASSEWFIDNNTSVISQDFRYPKCGNINPTSFCGLPFGDSDVMSQTGVVMFLGAVLMILLLTDLMIPSKNKPSNDSKPVFADPIDWSAFLYFIGEGEWKPHTAFHIATVGLYTVMYTRFIIVLFYLLNGLLAPSNHGFVK